MWNLQNHARTFHLKGINFETDLVIPTLHLHYTPDHINPDKLCEAGEHKQVHLQIVLDVQKRIYLTIRPCSKQPPVVIQKLSTFLQGVHNVHIKMSR